jgi:hypothetical protein
MRRCLMCFAPVSPDGGCLCTGSEERAARGPWPRAGAAQWGPCEDCGTVIDLRFDCLHCHGREHIPAPPPRPHFQPMMGARAAAELVTRGRTPLP